MKIMSANSLRFLGDESGSVDCTCNILDKESAIFSYVQYMLDRTNRMFQYENLPDTIPAYLLEFMLQVYGSVAILEHEENLYALRCNFGGAPDPYYRPTFATVSNPALNISKTYRIVNNYPPFERKIWDACPPCVRFLNDTQIAGLIPLFSRYATQMAENDVSVRSAQINLRQQTIIVADTGPEIQSAELYVHNLEKGTISSIQKRPFTDGVKVESVNSNSSNTIFQLIELQQYLKASWYNDIGLNSNFNMKRQYISADEIQSSADIMLPLVDNMFECRKQAVDSINKEFGTNIKVEKDSAWAKKQVQSDMSVSINSETGEIITPKTEQEIEEDMSSIVQLTESDDNESEGKDESKQSDDESSD